MAAIFTLTVFTISIVVVRIATVGLTMTGVSKDLAQFQALSAFTGAGFTTKESEDIVNHPLRRRITMHLMLLGHVGIVVAIPSLILTFGDPGGSVGQTSQLAGPVGVLVGGLLLLFLIANNRHVEQLMWKVTKWALRRWGGIQLHDYTRLLHVSQDYVISELQMHDDDWLAGRTLEQSRLANEGVLVLGIEKPDGGYLGAPRGQTRLEGGDCLILYGRQEALLDLDERRAGMEGNVKHMLAVTRQMDIVKEEMKIESVEDVEEK